MPRAGWPNPTAWAACSRRSPWPRRVFRRCPDSSRAVTGSALVVGKDARRLVPLHNDPDRLSMLRPWLGKAVIAYGLGPRWKPCGAAGKARILRRWRRMHAEHADGLVGPTACAPH